MVSEACRTPAQLAASVATVVAPTGVVAIAKLAVRFPGATVTPAGTWAAALSLVRVTRVPPLGAATSSVTVPVAAWPPVTIAGLTANAASVGSAGGAVGSPTVNTADAGSVVPAAVVTSCVMVWEPFATEVVSQASASEVELLLTLPAKS